MMNLLNKEIKLAILDLDGTLLDSTGIWHEIDKDFFARRGMEVPKNYFQEICHLGLRKTAEFTKEKYGIKETCEEMLEEWRNASVFQYTHVIQLKPHVKDFLEYLKRNNVIISLATANDEELYRPCLERLDIMKYFSYIIDVNSVKEGKESPKIYEKINDHFNIPKENTIIVEDIVLGLRTGFENGYITIGVDDKASRDTEDLKKKYSNFYVYDLIELMN